MFEVLYMNLLFDRMVLDNIVWLRLVCTKKIKRPGVFGLDGFGQHLKDLLCSYSTLNDCISLQDIRMKKSLDCCQC
jgi:hypothetical protein